MRSSHRLRTVCISRCGGTAACSHLALARIDRHPLILPTQEPQPVTTPPNAPINARPDWKPARGNASTDFSLVKTQALDTFQSRYAICSVLHGAPAIFSEDLSAAFCRAINDWVAREFLDKDECLRASIVVPMHSPEFAAKAATLMSRGTRESPRDPPHAVSCRRAARRVGRGPRLYRGYQRPPAEGGVALPQRLGSSRLRRRSRPRAPSPVPMSAIEAGSGAAVISTYPPP